MERFPRQCPKAATWVCAAAVFWAAAALSAQSLPYTFYPVGNVNGEPVGLAAGPDGAIWFTDSGTLKIGRMTAAGQVTEYSVPTSVGDTLGDIVAGTDALWYYHSTQSSVKVGRITTTGSITEFSVPEVSGFAVGPDNALWFAEQNANKIGRITASGAVAEFSLPTSSSQPFSMAVGPDQAMWFAESVGQIGRITTSGTITEFPLLTQTGFTTYTRDRPTGSVVAGPDGALWFPTSYYLSGWIYSLGRITTAGAFSHVSLPHGVQADSLGVGPDGAFWFNQIIAGIIQGIGRITTGGAVNLYQGLYFDRFVSGPDGALWFAQDRANAIGHIQILPTAPPVISAAITASGFGGSSSMAPGTWIEIYGSNLAPIVPRSWVTGDFTGTNAPTSLDGVKVTVGGQPAFVEYISPSQINVQVPDVTTGSQSLIVTTSAGPSAAYSVTVNAVQPGVYAPASAKIGGTQYAVATFPDGTLVLPEGAIPCVPSLRAQPGDTLLFYGVGFGPVSPPVPAGQITGPQNQLNAPVTVSFGQSPAMVLYSGLAGSAVGLDQFNVIVPNVSFPSDPAVTFTLGGTPVPQNTYIALQGPGPVPMQLNVSNPDGTVADTGTVVLTGPAPSGGAVVGIFADNNAAQVLNCQVTVNAGSNTASFKILTPAETSDDTPTTFTAMYNGSSVDGKAVVPCNPGSSGSSCGPTFSSKR